MTYTNPVIASYLADNGYADLDAWMADSDYNYDKSEGVWFDENGNQVDPETQLLTAVIEAEDATAAELASVARPCWEPALDEAILIELAQAALRHPAEFVLGLAEARGAAGMTYDGSPDSPRSEAYDFGRTVGEVLIIKGSA